MTITSPSVQLRGHAAWLFMAAAGLSFCALLVIAFGAYFADRMPPGPVSAAKLETLSVPAGANWTGPIKAQDLKRR